MVRMVVTFFVLVVDEAGGDSGSGDIGDEDSNSGYKPEPCLFCLGRHNVRESWC